MRKLKYLLLTLTFLLPGSSSAQEKEVSKGLIETYQVEIVLGLSVLVCLVALIAMYTLLVAMKTMLRMKMQEDGVVQEESELIKAREGEEALSFWGKFWNRFHEAVPVEKEETIVADHEYDGIRELDNQLPTWWLYGFYFSILFGVVYLFFYTFGSGQTQDQEFQAEMKKAKEDVKIYLAAQGNMVDENSVVLLDGSGDIAAGKAVFEANCSVCHANDGGGGIGPNFTDRYWLHGGDMPAIFKTIKYGVPEKGMISWEAQLSPKKMAQVASYIYLMEGTVSENPKDPQGELFERVPVDNPADSTATISANAGS